MEREMGGAHREQINPLPEMTRESRLRGGWGGEELRCNHNPVQHLLSARCTRDRRGAGHHPSTSWDSCANPRKR